MNPQNMSLYAAAGIMGLTTTAALVVGSIELLTGQPLNTLVAGFLTSAVVAAAGTLGYHLGNGKGPAA